MLFIALRGRTPPPPRGRWRRRTVYCLATLFVLFIFPGLLGAAATAQDHSTPAGISRMDGVAWMNIRDSSGVALADYLLVVDPGSLHNPGGMVTWSLLGLEFVVYMIIVTTAIWWLGFTLSFRWLDLFASALQGVANALTAQIATPIVLLTAASIGAFFVAWFIVRGFPAKAVAQVVTMFLVAIVGPVFLAAPTADVLSSDGLMARGRDLGISIAAGVNGSSDRNPTRLIDTLQGQMADTFARRPVQVWNFGHVLDERTTCGAAWSAGIAAGDDKRAKTIIENCGDSQAIARMENPSAGQLCTGLILLLSALVSLVFAVYLSGRILKAALDAIYQAFLAIFGFAAGGFVYGPSQTFLVRNLVGIGTAAVRMCAYTMFLGIYLLFLTNLFRVAGGQVIAVTVIAAMVEIIAILQLSRLHRGLSRGSSWIANRIASTIQGASGANGSGGIASSGGIAIGMGSSGTSAKGSGSGLIGTLATINTINTSPVLAWAAGRTLNPLNPYARASMLSLRTNVATADSRRESWQWQHLGRHNWLLLAISEADKWGGIDTELGLSRALKYVHDNKIPDSQLIAVLQKAGASSQAVTNALRARAVQENTKFRNPFGFEPLQKAVAATYAVGNHADSAAARSFAAQAVLTADSLVRHTLAPPPNAALNQAFIRRVEQNWDSDTALRATITADEWNNVGRETRHAIGHRVSREHLALARAHYENPTENSLTALLRSAQRLANLNHSSTAQGLDPWDP